LVSTPTSNLVVVYSVCCGCSVVVGSFKFNVLLTSLSLKKLDVILRMNWFSINHTLIDCRKKNFIPLDLRKIELVSTPFVLSNVKDEVNYFIILSVIDKNESELISIPVV